MMPGVGSADPWSCVNNVEYGAEDDDDTSVDKYGNEVDDPGVNDDDDDAGDSGDHNYDSDDSGVNYAYSRPIVDGNQWCLNDVSSDNDKDSGVECLWQWWLSLCVLMKI